MSFIASAHHLRKAHKDTPPVSFPFHQSGHPSFTGIDKETAPFLFLFINLGYTLLRFWTPTALGSGVR